MKTLRKFWTNYEEICEYFPHFLFFSNKIPKCVYKTRQNLRGAECIEISFSKIWGRPPPAPPWQRTPCIVLSISPLYEYIYTVHENLVWLYEDRDKRVHSTVVGIFNTLYSDTLQPIKQEKTEFWIQKRKTCFESW